VTTAVAGESNAHETEVESEEVQQHEEAPGARSYGFPSSSRDGSAGSRMTAGRHSARVHGATTGIATVGVVTILISAWGALIPFVEPLFGYHVTGTPSWHWNAAHTLLAVVPGAVGMVMGFVVLWRTSQVQVVRGRMQLMMAGLITMLCGAWFIVGPTAWPVISTHSAYFAPAAPLRSLLYRVGYAIGTGVILAVCGGYVLGWASRHPISVSATPGSNGSSNGSSAPMASPELVVAPPPTPATVVVDPPRRDRGSSAPSVYDLLNR
jgi:hypothetical protein